MSRYSVAIVLLSLVAGGAVGYVYENARQGAAAVGGVARTEANAETEAGAADVAPTGGAGDATSAGGAEGEAAASAPAARAVRRTRVARGRADAPARANSRPVAVRGYVRVPRRESGDGGRNVAGHLAGGVKKTGAVVAKPFVKVGGLFHD